MATTTSTRPVDTTSSPPVRRSVSLADRVALRIGLALVLWSRRTRRPARPEPTRSEQARRASLARAERQRLAAWQRDATVLGRWR